jgi:hypothetical protein
MRIYRVEDEEGKGPSSNSSGVWFRGSFHAPSISLFEHIEDKWRCNPEYRYAIYKLEDVHKMLKPLCTDVAEVMVSVYEVREGTFFHLTDCEGGSAQLVFNPREATLIERISVTISKRWRDDRDDRDD